MKLLVVAGARPNFMKVAPILRAGKSAGHECILVHTGQHFDAKMSDAFFRDLDIPEPDHHLGIGGGSHAKQTARIMEAFEPVLSSVRPDWVVVVGDVDSTLACSLVTAKLRHGLHCRLAHVEAGLRSHDWRMPEEINRVLTDRLADLLLLPSRDALANLAGEGIPAERTAFVGNVMIDTLLALLPRAKALDMPKRLGVARDHYILATAHRPSNVDGPAALRVLVDAIARVAQRRPVVLPLHPRTRASADKLSISLDIPNVTVTEPFGYIELISLLDGSAAVLTDSGGIQEETTVLGVPCVTLREQTERPVTVTEGTNKLAAWPLTVDGIIASTTDALARGRIPVGSRTPDGWDGRAAERIVAALASSTAAVS